MSHGVSKFQPVHRPWHVYVRKYYSNVVSAFEDLNRLVSIGSLDNLETFIFSNLDGAQANERLVFHDEDHRSIGSCIRMHAKTTRLVCETF